MVSSNSPRFGQCGISRSCRTGRIDSWWREPSPRPSPIRWERGNLRPSCVQNRPQSGRADCVAPSPAGRRERDGVRVRGRHALTHDVPMHPPINGRISVYCILRSGERTRPACDPAAPRRRENARHRALFRARHRARRACFRNGLLSCTGPGGTHSTASLLSERPLRIQMERTGWSAGFQPASPGDMMPVGNRRSVEPLSKSRSGGLAIAANLWLACKQWRRSPDRRYAGGVLIEPPLSRIFLVDRNGSG